MADLVQNMWGISFSSIIIYCVWTNHRLVFLDTLGSKQTRRPTFSGGCFRFRCAHECVIPLRGIENLGDVMDHPLIMSAGQRWGPSKIRTNFFVPDRGGGPLDFRTNFFLSLSAFDRRGAFDTVPGEYRSKNAQERLFTCLSVSRTIFGVLVPFLLVIYMFLFVLRRRRFYFLGGQNR